MTLTIRTLKNMLKTDNQTNTKKTCHLSNDVLARMCEMLDQDQQISVELTRSKTMVNRGSTFEILFKMLLNSKCNANVTIQRGNPYQADIKSTELSQDLCETLGLPMEDLEIKFSTSFASATSMANPNINAVLVANSEGIYLGLAKNLVLDRKGKIRPVQPRFTKLEKLSQIMGY